jgi:nitric oxide dioxygenase
MLKTAAEKQPEREVTFIHAAINSKTHAFKDEVKKIAEETENINTYFVYEKPLDEDFGYDQTGYIDTAWLKKVLPQNNIAEYYFCGPVPFMQVINHALQEMNIPKENIHFEFFGPASDLEKEKVNA